MKMFIWLCLICAFFITSLCEASNEHEANQPYSICDIQKVQVYLIPLDDFPSNIAVRLARSLSEDLGICVKGTIEMGSRGLTPFSGTNQYAAEDIVAMSSSVIEHLPEKQPNTTYVLLTKRDINEKVRNFRFLFAWHEKQKKVSVVSAARMLFEGEGVPSSNEKILSRFYKMTKRSIGEQYFGLTRSSDIRDVMYSPIMSLYNLDEIGTNYLQINNTRITTDKTEALVQTTTKLIINNELEGLKPLCLLPETYSKEEQQKELNCIIEALRLISKEFGTAGELKINNDVVQWYELIIGGGDLEFKKMNSKFVQIVYRTEFSNIGSGFIILQVAEDSRNIPKLLGVGYALPVNQKNEKIALGIARKIMELIESKSKLRSI